MQFNPLTTELDAVETDQEAGEIAAWRTASAGLSGSEPGRLGGVAGSNGPCWAAVLSGFGHETDESGKCVEIGCSLNPCVALSPGYPPQAKNRGVCRFFVVVQHDRRVRARAEVSDDQRSVRHDLIECAESLPETAGPRRIVQFVADGVERRALKADERLVVCKHPHASRWHDRHTLLSRHGWTVRRRPNAGRDKTTQQGGSTYGFRLMTKVPMRGRRGRLSTWYGILSYEVSSTTQWSRYQHHLAYPIAGTGGGYGHDGGRTPTRNGLMFTHRGASHTLKWKTRPLILRSERGARVCRK